MYYLKKKKKDSLFDRTQPVGGAKIKRRPSRKTLVDKLDKVFSLYIRLRDSAMYGHKYFRCISCGKVKPFEQADAGHYMSRKHMATRFSEMNVHAECRSCNRFSADHLAGFRRSLVAMYGEDKVVMLEYTASQTVRLSDFELEQMLKYYTALVNRMRG